MENNATQQPAQPQQPLPAAPLQQKKVDAEFSMKWHLKVLAVIYAVLGVFYIMLKIFLK